MSTETDDQPAAAGVEGPGNAAQTDDIDTEAFDRVEVPDEDAETASSGDDTESAEADDEAKPEGDAADDVFEFEDDEGNKHKLPAKLKSALLKAADYTQKTQEVAATRRELAEKQAAWEAERTQQTESLAELRVDHAKVIVLEDRHAALKERMNAFAEVDWEAYAASDPDACAALRDRQRATRDALLDASEALTGAKEALTTKEKARLTATQEAQAAALAKRQQEAGNALRAEDAGWTGPRFAEVGQYVNREFGITPEDLADTTDPRFWKMAHRLMAREAEVATLKKTKAQQTTADNHARAQAVTPAKTTSGGAAVSPRDPSKASGDALSTKEWVRRREAQVAARRR